MKKAGFIISVLLLIILNGIRVRAEEMNQYELEVVQEAKKVYEVDGVQYQLDDTYIDLLEEYLAAPELDLTKEQKDVVISKIYENLNQGITEGYLIPIVQEEVVVNKEINGEQPNDDGVESKDEITSNQEDESTDNSKAFSNTTESVENSDAITDNNINISEQIDGLLQNDEGIANTENNDIVDNILETAGTDKTIRIEYATGTLKVEDTSNTTVLTLNTVIKNTGFSLEQTIITIILVVCIMIIALIVTYRFNIIAHNHE
jgi:uncharacterized protein YoaH (UPF0181 family)